MIFWISLATFFIPLLTILLRFCFKLAIVFKSIVRVVMKARNKPEPTPSKKIEALNHLFGSIEYGLRPLRNPIVGSYHLFLLIQGIYWYYLDSTTLIGLQITTSLLILALIFYSQTNWDHACLKIAEFARLNPDLGPQSFFKRLKQILGPIPWDLPDPKKEPTIDPAFVDFRKTHRPKQKFSILFPLLWDTAVLAHISLKAMKMVGLDYARPIFDVMSSMWGKRTLERINGALIVKGAQKLQTLNGKFILIFNHKSQIDFILPFFGLSHAITGLRRPLKPRFITAKDHFVDNPFVYDLLGVGKLIEAVDMVFIERTKKGSGQKDLEQAATFLANKDIDIAIFPQGTRALGNYDRSGKRRDAGYYTTIPPKDIGLERGHLRKGAAFLAADTLIKMAQKNEDDDLHIIVIGLKGTASIMPKESLKMQTETETTIELMDPLTYSTDIAQHIEKPQGAKAITEKEQNYLLLVDEITKKIDETLIDCLEIHQSLYHKFLVDLQGQLTLDADKISRIETRLKERKEITDTFFQSLDRIYACPQTQWNRFLSQLAQMICDDAELTRFKQVREEITQTMLGKIKTKLHGQKVKV